MSNKITAALAQILALAAKAELDGGKLYLFSGAVPADASDALDMVAVHTQAVEISLASAGTGINFDTPVAGVLGKAAGEVWSGVVATDGFQGGLTTIVPTFYRFCEAADNGRGAATTQNRLQGTVGGPNSGADLQLGNGTLTEGNTQPVGAFAVVFG